MGTISLENAVNAQFKVTPSGFRKRGCLSPVPNFKFDVDPKSLSALQTLLSTNLMFSIIRMELYYIFINFRT